jgi:hypothetical protein
MILITFNSTQAILLIGSVLIILINAELTIAAIATGSFILCIMACLNEFEGIMPMLMHARRYLASIFVLV